MLNSNLTLKNLLSRPTYKINCSENFGKLLWYWCSMKRLFWKMPQNSLRQFFCNYSFLAELLQTTATIISQIQFCKHDFEPVLCMLKSHSVYPYLSICQHYYTHQLWNYKELWLKDDIIMVAHDRVQLVA